MECLFFSGSGCPVTVSLKGTPGSSTGIYQNNSQNLVFLLGIKKFSYTLCTCIIKIDLDDTINVLKKQRNSNLSDANSFIGFEVAVGWE